MKTAEAFLSAIERRAKLFAPTANATFRAHRELCSWVLDPLARWADAAYGEQAFDDAALGYAKYCLGVAQAQQSYERAGKYTPEAMPEIVSGVYEDEGYMVPYMWAAILIYAFWPSMIAHIALFRDEFLRRLPRNATVLELASGHGVLSLLAAQERPDIRVVGLDISPPAVAVAKRLLAASGHGERVSFAVADALRSANPGETTTTYQGIISAMLAEHLPTPKPLFDSLGAQTAPQGLVFFSTALESAQRDHVFEFHRESEPLRMAEDAGLRVLRLVSDSSATPPQARFVPRATAMLLQAR
ncbi:MAG: class I SAM-dependent methyltransferase [Gammaproteobacteria bacterium]|nr:class I SAM-dependent methyltransferase [Gammaproteobacteria bacterium]MBV8307924.1 class I SAM-dependent methyltransferase [Gammaproteobacteria bacterium]